MSSNTPDPVAHMSDLKDLEQRFELKLEKLKNDILRWMLVGAMAALKLFG
jgi:hypothetical protein